MSNSVLIDGISLSTYTNIGEIEIAWKRLENSGVAMAFQNYEWCKTWIDQVAPSVDAIPLVVCGRDAAEKMIFILPFQKREVGRFRLLEWLGQQNGTACSGLFDNSFCSESGQASFTQNLPQILNFLEPLEAINLRHMPKTIVGKLNPLAVLHQTLSANASFILDLQPHYGDLCTAIDFVIHCYCESRS